MSRTFLRPIVVAIISVIACSVSRTASAQGNSWGDMLDSRAPLAEQHAAPLVGSNTGDRDADALFGGNDGRASLGAVQARAYSDEGVFEEDVGGFDGACGGGGCGGFDGGGGCGGGGCGGGGFGGGFGGGGACGGGCGGLLQKGFFAAAIIALISDLFDNKGTPSTSTVIAVTNLYNSTNVTVNNGGGSNPNPNSTPTPVVPTPVPTDTPSPMPTQTSAPTQTPYSTATPQPTNTPVPTETPCDTPSPDATATPVPTETPCDTPSPEATATPVPTETPCDTPSPEPTATPVPTETPCETPSPEPTHGGHHGHDYKTSLGGTSRDSRQGSQSGTALSGAALKKSLLAALESDTRPDAASVAAVRRGTRPSSTGRAMGSVDRF